jgi:hypothetical protein
MSYDTTQMKLISTNPQRIYSYTSTDPIEEITATSYFSDIVALGGFVGTVIQVSSPYFDVYDPAIYPTLTIISISGGAGTARVPQSPFAVLPSDRNGTSAGISTGTFQPNRNNGLFQFINNAGAHTFSSPSADGSMKIKYTNVTGAGAINTASFTFVTGAFSTVVGAKFMCDVTRMGSDTLLQIVPMQ